MTGDELPEGWYYDEKGRLCFGDAGYCFMPRLSAEGGIEIEFDASKCPPEVKDALYKAAPAGANVHPSCGRNAG